MTDNARMGAQIKYCWSTQRSIKRLSKLSPTDFATYSDLEFSCQKLCKFVTNLKLFVIRNDERTVRDSSFSETVALALR